MSRPYSRFSSRFKKGQIVYCIHQNCDYSNMQLGDTGEIIKVDEEEKGYSVKIKDKEYPDNRSFMREYELGNRRELIEMRKELFRKRKGKQGRRSRLCHTLTI